MIVDVVIGLTLVVVILLALPPLLAIASLLYRGSVATWYEKYMDYWIEKSFEWGRL